MNLSTIEITGTRAYASSLTRKLLFEWPMLIVYAAVLLIFGGLSIQNGDPLPLVFTLFFFGFTMHIIQRYLRERLENDAVPLHQNPRPADYLSAEVIKQLGRVKRKGITAGDILDAAIRTKRGKFILEELGISDTEIRSRCAKYIDENTDITSFLKFASTQLPEFHESRVDANVILFLFFVHVPCCTELLHVADMSEDDLKGLLQWEAFHHRFRVKQSFWEPEAIRSNTSMGRSWVMGYTDALDQLTSEVDSLAHTAGERSVVIHTDAIDNVMRTLGRGKQRNVLILGKIGVGKKTLVQHIASSLRTLERAKHRTFTRVLLLHTEKLLSGVGNSDTFLLHALARAHSSGHFILVIKDIALLLRSANTNLKAVLYKFLESKNISVIGIADIQDYHSIVKTDPMLDSLFEKIPVEDSTDEETMAVLMAHYFALERSHVRITYKALKSILELSRRYLGSFGGFPGKALDVMDDAILRATDHGHAFVNEEHVREVISLKGKVNVKRVNEGEKERLLGLEEKLKREIIGQENAIRAVSSALKRARLDLHERKRPVGTFLFLGPTGVGKTQTAKVLAEEYFGAADAMVRLDMNEYSHADSVFNIIGSSNGGAEGFLAQRVQDKPFSLILLDEIEKAHPAVLNLFLQILDEGFLNDSRGMRTDFRNTIIIATSNAGALFIRDFVKQHENYSKESFKTALVETILRDKLFSPEFINRFDELVLFYPLTQEGAAQVAALMLDDIISDVQKRRGIKVSVEPDVVIALVERGYSVEFGAREMRRTITEMIEDYLADYMLRNEVRRGQEIIIKASDLKW